MTALFDRRSCDIFGRVVDESELRPYLCPMPKVAFEPCIPTRGTKVPAGPDWLHEIKHDGYRLIVQREGKVSKHRDRAYSAGTSPNWVKVKNPKHPAMKRVKEAFRAGPLGSD
jgi:ATP-dependent DNA ligase